MTQSEVNRATTSHNGKKNPVYPTSAAYAMTGDSRREHTCSNPKESSHSPGKEDPRSSDQSPYDYNY